MEQEQHKIHNLVLERFLVMQWMKRLVPSIWKEVGRCRMEKQVLAEMMVQQVQQAQSQVQSWK